MNEDLKLNNLYFSPSMILAIKSRRWRWVGLVPRMGERRGAYRVMVGKPEGMRPVGRPRRRWKVDIKMELQEVVWEAWNGLILLIVGTGGGHLCVW
jgi:hypothetical protein